MPSLLASEQNDPSKDTIVHHEREIVFDSGGFVAEVTDRVAGGAIYSKTVYTRAVGGSNALVSKKEVCDASDCSGEVRTTEFTYDGAGNLKTRTVNIPIVAGSTDPAQRLTERWTYVGNWVDRYTIEEGPAGSETVIQALQTTPTPEVVSGAGPARISARFGRG